VPHPDEEVEYFLDPEAWVALRDLNNGPFKAAPIPEEVCFSRTLTLTLTPNPNLNLAPRRYAVDQITVVIK
jgi:hypothetical protein